MKNIVYTLVVVFAFAIGLMACGGEEKKPTEEKVGDIVVTNPNGMSEMSIIMEEWYQVLLKYSKQLRDNYEISSFETIRQKDIYKAKTSKEGVHGEQFNNFVENFFYNFNEIENTISYGEQVAQFNLAVTSCINCHQQYCHGPIERIQKLKVNN